MILKMISGSFSFNYRNVSVACTSSCTVLCVPVLSISNKMHSSYLTGRLEQVNEITSFIDASIVYESTLELTNKLRNLSEPSE